MAPTLRFRIPRLAITFAAIGIALLQLTLSPVWADSPGADSRRALVVGISAYDHRQSMPHAVSNARKLAWILEHNNFQVTLVTDPSGRQFHQALNALANKPTGEPGDTVLLYFCGRAESHITPDGVEIGWLIPRDGPVYEDDPGAFSRSAVSTFQLDRLTEKVKTNHMLVVLDASFSSDIFDIRKPLLRQRSVTAPHAARQYIFTQPQSGMPLPETNLFFTYLVRGLKGEADSLKDGWVTGSELAQYLSQILAARHDRAVRYAVSRNPDYAAGDVTLKALTLPQKTGRLYVDVRPMEAIVRIMNIRPKFEQGIDLEAGRYHLAVTAPGFQKKEKWIDVAAGEMVTETLTLEEATTKVTNSRGMTFQWLEPGTFTMGTPPNHTGYIDNETGHPVRLTKGFFIQTTEVTRAQYARFLKDSGYSNRLTALECWRHLDGEMGWRKAKNSPAATDGGAGKDIDQQPVTCVSWHDARAFASWLSRKEGKNYRLPTEAQWEYACRSGHNSAFAFGDCLTREQAHYDSSRMPVDNCRTTPVPPAPSPMQVGRTTANDWGLFDMHGNVAEWCSDWYGTYPDGSQRDPNGPEYGVEKVIRGGHFRSFANECRSARRSGLPPNEAADTVGFRLVLVP